MINLDAILEEAVKDHVKHLFEAYLINKMDDDKSAKAKFKNGLKICMDAMKELSDGPLTA